MKTQSILGYLTTGLLLLSCTTNEAPPSSSKEAPQASEITELAIKNLLRDSLHLSKETEIIVSHLEMPKNTTLPTHYHPGEEFVYLMEGSGELILGDQPKKIVNAGDFVKIPYEQVHSFSTSEKSAKAIIFRVHRKGQPDRILVE